jgi:hypothetical protein
MGKIFIGSVGEFLVATLIHNSQKSASQCQQGFHLTKIN